MKYSHIDIPQKYILEEQRWDILAKALTVALRNKKLRELDLSKAVVEMSISKFGKLDIAIFEESK